MPFTSETPRWRVWLAIASLSLTFAILSSLIGYVVDRRSDQRWCSIVTTMDETWRAQPPPTSSGRKLAAEIAQLRKEFNCKEAS